ncbi:MAG TPA: hypothetical protein VGB03_07355, partial [Acidimicrobiales bacterium]
GAHLRNLRRTAIGSFTVDQAACIDTDLPVLSPAEALRDYPTVTLSADDVLAVRQGKRVDLPAGVSRVLDPDGNLVAVAEAGRTAVVLSL